MSKHPAESHAVRNHSVSINNNIHFLEENQDISFMLPDRFGNKEEIVELFQSIHETLHPIATRRTSQQSRAVFKPTSASCCCLAYDPKTKLATIYSIGDSAAYCILTSKETNQIILVKLSKEDSVNHLDFDENGNFLRRRTNSTSHLSFDENASILHYDFNDISALIENCGEVANAHDWKLGSFFVASKGFGNFKNLLLKDENRQMLHFDKILDFTEERDGKKYFETSSNPVLSAEERTKLNVIHENFCTTLKTNKSLENIDFAQTLAEDFELFTLILAKFAREYGSKEDITIEALRTYNDNFSDLTQEDKQILLAISDGDGEKGSTAAKKTLKVVAEKFYKSREVESKRRPASSVKARDSNVEDDLIKRLSELPDYECTIL